MNTQLSIQQLRQKGFKVRVRHFRYSRNGNLLPLFEFRRLKDQNQITPLGGKTIVEITTPNNIDIQGVAICNKIDPFNRKIANRIAIGRALKQLTESLPEN